MSILRQTFERMVDLLIDRIIQFTDYFIVVQKITLSEAALFGFSATRFVWIATVGVSHDAYDPVFGTPIWVLVFGVLSLLHLVSFFSAYMMFRFYVMCLHAFVWCFLTLLAAWSGTTVPVVPNLAVITAVSIFIAVRLRREITHQASHG